MTNGLGSVRLLGSLAGPCQPGLYRPKNIFKKVRVIPPGGIRITETCDLMARVMNDEARMTNGVAEAKPRKEAGASS